MGKRLILIQVVYLFHSNVEASCIYLLNINNLGISVHEYLCHMFQSKPRFKAH